MARWNWILGALALTLVLRADYAASQPVMGVQAAATAIEGTTLVLPEYTVPVDGLLVVRVGTQGGVSDSVTFDGVEMMEAASSEVLFFPWTVSSEVRYLDVEEGESGPIVVRYGHSGTDGKSVIAATIAGEYVFDSAAIETAEGPNLAPVEVSASPGDVVFTTITVHGNGIPEIAGPAHVLDGYPTVPESAFHEMKHLGGQLDPLAFGDHTLSYRNTRASGWMNYALIATSFTPVPEPGLGVALAAGVLSLLGRRNRHPGLP